jgi:hypothetical protein
VTELEIAHKVIKDYFLRSDLPQLIGEALGKDGVLIALIDTPGRILVIGNSTPGALNDKRNAIMVRQMADLLKDHMNNMMKTAGKESKEL